MLKNILMLYGNAKSGKTAALHAVFNLPFSESYRSTIGEDWLVPEWNGHNPIYIGDISGQENCRSIISQSRPYAYTAVIFIDLSQHKDNDSMRQAIAPWLAGIGPNHSIFLMGSKRDLLSEDELPHVTEALRQVALTRGFITFIGSSKTKTGKLLGATCDEDVTLGSVLPVAITMTTTAALFANTKHDQFDARHCIHLRDLSLSHETLRTILKNTGNLHEIAVPLLRNILSKGSQSMIDLNALLRQTRPNEAIDGLAILSCLSDAQKDRWLTWQVNPSASAESHSSEVVIRQIWAALRLPITPLSPPNLSAPSAIASSGVPTYLNLLASKIQPVQPFEYEAKCV